MLVTDDKPLDCDSTGLLTYLSCSFNGKLNSRQKSLLACRILYNFFVNIQRPHHSSNRSSNRRICTENPINTYMSDQDIYVAIKS